MRAGLFAAVFVFVLQAVFAQGKVSDAPDGRGGSIAGTLPLKRVSLLTSGVGYFEHSGTVNGEAEVGLSFHLSAMNDALKSLVVRDPNGTDVQVRYPSENSQWTALEDLLIDLRGGPDIIEMLRRQQGAEVTLTVLAGIRFADAGREPQDEAGQFGRFRQFEQKVTGALLSANDKTVSVSTADGIRVIETSALRSVAFTDPRLNEDLRKALAVLTESRNAVSRRVTVSLGGNGTREAGLSYVIPAAVWKASYRLDLSAAKPFLQAWAIVDNDSGNDWENTELTLVSGRPVSFVQQLYPPYHLGRPVKPLEIAGAAEAQVYGGAMMKAAETNEYDEYAEDRSSDFMRARAASAPSPMAAGEPAERGYVLAQTDTAGAGKTDAGFLFEWTFKAPVTIARGQSVMLLLTEGEVEARKALIFNGRNASAQGAHPQIGVELTNTTGQNLPPGPVTVFDSGSYAGDALVSFLGAGEKRLLSFADDLSVSGSVSANSRRVISAVKISGGVMTVTRKTSYERVYTFNNTSLEEKTVIIEHPIRLNTALAVPEKADEQTENTYRFNQSIPARRSLSFQVVEEIPASEQLSLTSMSIDGFVSYASNMELPQNVRAALQQAVALREAANAAASQTDETRAELTRAEAEQARIRDNLTAVGTGTEAGGQYLARLREIDTRIDTINADYDKALSASRAATKAYNDYIAGLEL
jgi:hypothetical protein